MDQTKHNLETHAQKLCANDKVKPDEAAALVMQRYNEDGTAKEIDGRTGHSLAWYQSWGTPAKCPTCGAPAKVTDKEG